MTDCGVFERPALCINGISPLSKQSCENWKRSQLAPLFVCTVQRRPEPFVVFPRGSGVTFYAQWAATRVAVVVLETVGVLIRLDGHSQALV